MGNETPNSSTLDKLKSLLSVRGISDISDEVLQLELDNAKTAINNRLCVAYDTEIPERYIDVQIELCIEAISKYGADGQISHTENGIDRKYDSANIYSQSTLNKIIPKLGVL